MIVYYDYSPFFPYLFMAKYTNSLRSHCPERNTSRADKMSGWINKVLEADPTGRGKYKREKELSNRKRRRFLNNPFNWDKLEGGYS